MNNIPLQLNTYSPIYEQIMSQYSLPTQQVSNQLSQADVDWIQQRKQQLEQEAQQQAEEMQRGNVPRSDLEDRSGNIFENFGKDVRSIGTGLVNMWVHKGEIPQAVADYINSNPNYVKDLANMVLSTYNTEVDDFGKLPAREIVANVLQGINEKPAQALLDALSLGAGKVVGKLAKPIAKGTATERGISTIRAETGTKLEKANQFRANMVEKADKAGIDLKEIMDAAETGKTIPKSAMPAFEEARQFSKEWDKLAAELSPSTHVGNEQTAIVQNILRNREKVNPQMTFAQVEKDVTPLLERIKAGEYNAVKQLAKEGNQTAKEVVRAKALYDKGRIFAMPHGLASVEHTGEAVVRGAGGTAGQFSKRLYGTSTFADIANQMRKPNEWMENAFSGYVDKAITQDLLRGSLGGQVIAPDNAARARYIPRQALIDGDLKTAFAESRKNMVLADDIPIDVGIFNALKEQRNLSGSALNGITKALYNLTKGNLLAGGTYTGANVITGISNAIMNSGAMLIPDILAAIASKGKLSKNLGTFRMAQRQIDRIPVIEQIEKFNRKTGGAVFGEIDRNVQNFLSEVAAHAELRKAGVYGMSNKLKAGEILSRQKLGEVINDIRRAALINSPNVPLPAAIKDTLFAFSPFWRWQVTASQATLRMLEKNPLLANVALVDVISNIGFDREMQNRLSLGVNSDRPYVSYRINDKTGQTEEVSAEFTPMTTPIITFDLRNNRFAPSVPFISSIMNASQGKDKYGNVLKFPETNGTIIRAIGGKNYKYTPETGWQEYQAEVGDYVNAAIKELIGLPTLYNKTLAPLISSVVSPTGEYYKPYSGSLLGSFTQDFEGNRIVGGNPNAPRTAKDVIEAFGGMYSTDYSPTREERGLPTVSGQTIRQLIKGRNRQYNRLGL